MTVEEYRRFNARYGIGEIEGQARTADSPVIGTNWYQAVVYCNWLSNEEGIPEDQWCYEIKGNVTKLKEKYLSLSGYRLPTEAEMEYATRAGALTSRYYGETEELLSKYAWYNKNSQERTWPVGSLKPNDLGLFDVQGNAFTWCQESFKGYPQGEEVSEDKEDVLTIVSTNNHVLRGGSFSPSSVERPLFHPLHQRAVEPQQQQRFPSREDIYSLVPLLLYCLFLLSSVFSLPPLGGRKEKFEIYSNVYYRDL